MSYFQSDGFELLVPVLIGELSSKAQTAIQQDSRFVGMNELVIACFIAYPTRKKIHFGVRYSKDGMSPEEQTLYSMITPGDARKILTGEGMPEDELADYELVPIAVQE